MNLDLTVHMVFNGKCAGEETVCDDNLVWITKTHWPTNSPMGAKKFSAQKCISIVRNPIDMIASMMYLKSTQTHTQVTDIPLHEADPEWWNSAVANVGRATNEAFLATE